MDPIDAAYANFKVLLILFLAIGTGVAHAQTNRPPTPSTQSMTGVVKAISASSLALETGGNDVFFDLTPSTRFVGKGLASDLVLRWPRDITNVVKRGDRVTVRYRILNSAMRAVELRAARK